MRSIPDPAFAFVPGNIFDCAAVGRAIHDIDAEAEFDAAYGPVATGQVWVAPWGSDANLGTLASPYGTLMKAMQSGAGTVWMMAGAYTARFQARGEYNNYAPVKIRAWSGAGTVVVRAAGAQPNALNWTPEANYPGTYSAVPPDGEVAAHLMLRESARDVQLQWYSTVAEVQASNCGWYQDGSDKRIYVNYGGAYTPVVTFLEIMYTRPDEHIIFGAKIYMEGLVFRGDSQLRVLFDGLNRPHLFAKDCEFSYLGYHNVQSYGARTLYQHCRSHHALGGDGFNYYDDAASGQPAEAVEVDCVGRDNGIPQYKLYDGQHNKQGSSTHEHAVICRINGQYFNNDGQNIADTYTTSKSWLVGCDLGTPATSGLENLRTEGAVWLDTVRAGGRRAAAGLGVATGIARQHNCCFASTVVGTDATLEDYVP